MFKVIEDPQFVHDVPVEVPDGDGWRTEMLRTRFRALAVSEMKAIDEAEGESLGILLDRIVVSFEDLADADGKPLPGDGEWRARLLEYPFVRAALIRGYYAAQTGTRLGNSGPSAAPGRGAS
ncbi:MAG: hypothetical protein ACOY4T_11820 [Pseudomonadota bacterium]